MEIGILKGELAEIKDSMRNSNHVVHLYSSLTKKHQELIKSQKDRDDKIRDLKKDVEELIIKLAQKNQIIKELEDENKQ